MNSTERLLCCLRGEIPDRVPISTYELVGWNGDSFENQEPSYRRLMDFIRQHTDCMYMCEVAVPNRRRREYQVELERYDEDNQHVTRTIIHTPVRSLTKVTSYSDDIKTVWSREHPVKNLADLAAYMKLPWEAGGPDFRELEKAWERLDDTRGLPLLSFEDPICELAEAFEFSNFMVHALEHTEAVTAALDELHERRVEKLKMILTGPVRNAIFRIVGPEYATPPYLPPELFRRFVTRYVREYVRMIQDAGAFARIHSHGKIAKVAEQIAQMAPDALDPLEPPPDGDIELAELKTSLGKRICLMGGIELKHLEHGEGEFVRQLVREAIETGKREGRFVIMPTAAPINIPLSGRTEDNYLRFIETALEAGRY